MAITEREQSWQPPFGTKTALLVTAEWNPWVEFKVRVNPDRACLNLFRQAIGTVHVPGPYRGSETHVGVVGFLDRFLFGLERDEWYDGTWRDCQYLYFFQSPTPPLRLSASWTLTERLFRNDARIVLWPVDDCGRDKVTRSVWVGPTHGDLPVLLLNVCKEPLYSFVLHRVLNGSEVDVGVGAWSELCTPLAPWS